jgi:hypothetical protein
MEAKGTKVNKPLKERGRRPKLTKLKMIKR